MEGVECRFSLIMYGFCSGNALYSASLTCRLFVIILTPFNTWDYYYFRLNVSLMLLMSFFCKKACNVVFKSSKNGEIMSKRRYCQKGLFKTVEFGKKRERRDSHVGELSIEGGFKSSARFVFNLSRPRYHLILGYVDNY